MSRLKERQLNTDSVIHRQEDQHLTICQLNKQSSPAHFQDLESCKSLTDCGIVGLAESWLHPGCQSDNYLREGFSLIRRDRQDIDNTCKQSKCGMCNHKGGVALYVKSSEYDQEIPQSQIADKPMAPRGRATQPSRDTKKTN